MVGVFGFTVCKILISFLIQFQWNFQECLFAWSSQFLLIYTGMICHASVILGLKIANFCENRITIHKKFISCTNFLDLYRLARGTLNLLDVCLSVCRCVHHISVFQTFSWTSLEILTWEIQYMNLSCGNTDQVQLWFRLTEFYRSYAPFEIIQFSRLFSDILWDIDLK